MTDPMAQGVKWDLSDLYASTEDPKILSDLNSAKEKAGLFETNYKPFFTDGRLSELPLKNLLKDYKEIITLTTRLGVYAHLLFASDTREASIGAFLAKTQSAITEILSHTLFFESHWNKMDAKRAEALMKEPGVEKDRHFLEKLRTYAPHTLSEGEEKIMAEKADSGNRAFTRLFDEVVNGISFKIEIKGRVEKKTEGEILSYLHSAEQSLRKKASESLVEGLSANARLLTYIYNMILADHRSDLKIRKMKHPMDPMNLSNEVALETVLNLVKSVKKAYPIAQDYYGLKKKLLGLKDFYDYDRYAPLATEEEKIDFESCKKIVLEGYYEFSEEAGKIIEQFFSRRWIDAEIRPGKQGGGFCCTTTPDLHPYILVNYTGSLRDVMTVAHELGHGLHQYLARKAGILENSAPLTMAETASVFGEMLIFDKIMGRVSDPKKKLELLCGKIDDNFATVFRQIAMTDFELKAHEAGLTKGELSEKSLNGFWIDANRDFYGKSVRLTDGYRHGWKYIPHFVHTPFYCYAYAYAQLFVLSLFQTYKKEKKSFIPKYFQMLELGGSRKPAEIAQIAGLDVNRPDFWQGGLDLLADLVRKANSQGTRYKSAGLES